jgi:hypothetical protein
MARSIGIGKASGWAAAESGARLERGADYFSEEAIAVYLLLITEPRPFTAATMATEIPAAIRPYSMEVAPDWQRRNFSNIVMIALAALSWRQREK